MFMNCLSTGSWPDDGARYRFHLMDQGLSSIGKWLGTRGIHATVVPVGLSGLSVV